MSRPYDEPPRIGSNFYFLVQIVPDQKSHHGDEVSMTLVNKRKSNVTSAVTLRLHLFMKSLGTDLFSSKMVMTSIDRTKGVKGLLPVSDGICFVQSRLSRNRR